MSTTDELDKEGGAAFDARLVRRLWVFVRPQRRRLLLGFALLLATMACRLALPYLVKVAIDDHFTPQVAEGFWILVALFVAVAVAEAAARRWQMLAVERAGQDALYDMRASLFRHLQGLPSRFFDRTPTGKLVGRVTTDVEALQELFTQGVVTILGDLVFLAATLWILFALDVRLTLVTLGVVPILLGLTLFIRTRVRVAYVHLRSRLSRLNGLLHEHISGMNVIQMFAQEERSRAEFGEINDGVRTAQLTTVRWESTLSALTDMLGSFTMAVLLWYGGGLALAGEPGGALGLTLGTLFAFIDYMGRFFQPLNDLSLKYTVLQNAMTAADRIFRLFDERGQIPEPAQPVPLDAPRGAIEFRDVEFAYDEGKPVLRGVSFALAPGERVAVVGATGAGKSTVLNLLTRLYDVDGGAVLIDGVDVRAYGLRELRGHVGIVPQDVFLFEGDVLENVRLGHPEISDEAALAAARELGLDEVVARFPGGYREAVRERGVNLSSGEKQLVAFARVLAVAPEVLVLDEATSSVDTHTEALLQAAVHRIMQGRTSLIIAHRLSTIRDVDRILVLHKGELVEEGSHEELLEQRGRYWRLYQLQYREQEGEDRAQAG